MTYTINLRKDRPTRTTERITLFLDLKRNEDVIDAKQALNARNLSSESKPLAGMQVEQ